MLEFLSVLVGSLLLLSELVDGLRVPMTKRRAGTFTNPILDGNYADPWVVKWNKKYYLTTTMPDGGVSIFVSTNFDHFNSSAAIPLWKASWSDCWAPELHRIDEQWYIYCATQDGDDDADRRLHVLQGTDPKDPTKPFVDLGVISTPDLNYAIDGTVLHNYNGANYFIWSGKETRTLDTVQYMQVILYPYLIYTEDSPSYIAKMANATTLIGNRTVIHSPYLPDGSRNQWQWSPSNTAYGVNEGPEVLQHGGQTFVIYSASGSWDDTYSLGIIGMPSKKSDPLDPKSWWRKEDGPIFQQNSVTAGTGHASYTTDANGVPYIVFHAWPKGSPAGWGARTVYTQKFRYGRDGRPILGTPVGKGVELPAPAGFS